MKTKLIFLTSILIIFTWSCIYENEEELYANLNNPNGKISFEKDIQPILEAHCYSCHNNKKNATIGFGNKFGENVSLEGEENVKKIIAFANQKGYFINNIKHESGFIKMPIGASKLSDANIELIEKWIAQEFTSVFDTIVIYDTVKVIINDTIKVGSVSYKTDVLPILQENCYTCHNNEWNGVIGFGDAFGTGVTLEGYENVKTIIEFNNKKGYLIKNMKHADGFIKMPYQSPKLPDSTITKIENWINQGYPNN